MSLSDLNQNTFTSPILMAVISPFLQPWVWASQLGRTGFCPLASRRQRPWGPSEMQTTTLACFHLEITFSSYYHSSETVFLRRISVSLWYTRKPHLGRNDRGSRKISLTCTCFLSFSCAPRQVWSRLGLLLHWGRGCRRHAALHVAGLLLGQEAETVPILRWGCRADWGEAGDRRDRSIQLLSEGGRVLLNHMMQMKWNPVESETSCHMEGLCKICERNVEHGMIQKKMDQRLKILQGVGCFYSTEYCWCRIRTHTNLYMQTRSFFFIRMMTQRIKRASRNSIMLGSRVTQKGSL